MLIIPTTHSRRMRSRAEGRSMPIIFRVRKLIKPDEIQAEYERPLMLSTSLFLRVYHFLSFHLPLPKVILSEYMLIMN